MEGSEKELDLILSRLKRKTDHDVSGYRITTIIRRLRRRLKATNSSNYSEYLVYMRDNPEEYEHLLNDIFIHVTDFFRDISVYENIQKKVIPRLFSLRNEKIKKIRIWSAGCDSGEEPYSLAICINEHLKTNKENAKITIIATDASERAISYAKNGIYTKREIANVPEKYISKYFQKHEDLYHISPELKKYIEFSCHNMISDNPLENIDLLLCRNVLIFFSEKTQRKVFRKLIKAINKGGFIVLGKAESLAPEIQKKFEVLDNESNIFERVK